MRADPRDRGDVDRPEWEDWSGREDWRGDIKPNKLGMEEARHVTCPSCGYSAGRHARSCLHRPVTEEG